MWLAAAVLVSGLVYFFRFLRYSSKPGNLPGPRALPILGNIFQMMTPFKTLTYPFTHFSKEYGEIYRLKVPFDEIVVLASYDAVHGIYSQEPSFGRDVGGVLDRNFGQNLGILFANGRVWEKTKHWVVRNLREYGLGKSKILETLVRAEIGDFFNQLENKESQILAMSHTFLTPVSHIIYKMMAGENTEIAKSTLDVMNAQTAIVEKASGFDVPLGPALAMVCPPIRYFFPVWTGRSMQITCRSTMQKESQRLMSAAKVKMSITSAEAESMTDKFVEQMYRGTDPEIFTEQNYDVVFADMFQASSNTTASYLEAMILYLVLYPDVQQKVYDEITDNIPIGQEIFYEDKKRMTYTHAVMLEVHRCAKIAQYLVPRRAREDLEYKNYRIKKNSILLVDINSMYSNPQIFENPSKFEPDRFLDSSGNIVNQKLIIAFSVGKRNCPGELFSDLTAFLFVLNLLRKFKLSCIPGKAKPKAEMLIGLTSSPYPYSVVLTRKQSYEM